MKKIFISVGMRGRSISEVESDEVKFQIKSNSQYVFQYMLTESIKKDIKKR